MALCPEMCIRDRGTDVGRQPHDLIMAQLLLEGRHLVLDPVGDDIRDIAVAHPDVMEIGSLIARGVGPMAMRAAREKQGASLRDEGRRAWGGRLEPSLGRRLLMRGLRFEVTQAQR